MVSLGGSRGWFPAKKLTLPSYGTRCWDAGRLRHFLLTRSGRRRGGQRRRELGHLGCERSARMDGSEVGPVRVLLQLKWNQPDESYSSFAELGCAIPLSGGAQAYLAYAVRLSPDASQSDLVHS
jgi:hypothetical protein